MNNLKPCPFCGSAATLEDHRLLWVARCPGCTACVLGDRAPEPEQEMPSAYWEPFRQSAVDRWNRRAAPPAPEVGEVGELVEWLTMLRDNSTGVATRYDDRLDRIITLLELPQKQSAPAPAVVPGEVGELVAYLQDHGTWLIQSGYANASIETRDLGIRVFRAAALLQQQAAPAPAVVPVAVSERDDGFMSGTCAALAVVTAHGEATVWREIVKAVGADSLLNYAANVNPEDWDLAGFNKYAQAELGKGRPVPLPQAGEGEA